MFKDLGSYILISNVKVPKSVFKYFEPAYQEPPEGFIRTYIPNRIHQLYNAAENNSFCLSPCWADGDRYIRRVDEFIRYMAQDRLAEAKAIKEVQKVKQDAGIKTNPKTSSH